MSTVVAIDGPSGSGKSSVARVVGELLGLDVLDTGAMYRAVTWAALDRGIDLHDAGTLTDLAERSRIEFDPSGRVTLDGRDVTREIRDVDVTGAVSTVSAHRGVRKVMVERQRDWVTRRGGGVVEGRDIGTVVFPDATLKVFLDAADDERARRRQRDEAAADRAVAVDVVREALTTRDAKDSSRAVGRLSVAPDAVVIDTTGAPVAEIARRIADTVQAAGAMTRFQHFFYGFIRVLLSGGIRLLWRAKIIGAQRIPAQGAFVLAPSHRSMFDIFVLACPTPRRLRFMGKRQLFEIPVLGALFRLLGGFPVDREAADRAALRTAMAMLEAGEPVVMYPEGTRGHGPVLGEMHDGASYLAARAGVPIVPVGIGGTEEILATGKVLPRFHKIAVVVGEPLLPPPRGVAVKRSGVSELTKQVRVALQDVFGQALVQAGVESGSGSRGALVEPPDEQERS